MIKQALITVTYCVILSLACVAIVNIVMGVY